MAATRSNEFYGELKKLINLPDNCKKLDLHMEVNSMVTVDCTYYPVRQDGSSITKRYTLQEVENQPEEFKDNVVRIPFQQKKSFYVAVGTKEGEEDVYLSKPDEGLIATVDNIDEAGRFVSEESCQGVCNDLNRQNSEYDWKVLMVDAVQDEG